MSLILVDIVILPHTFISQRSPQWCSVARRVTLCGQRRGEGDDTNAPHTSFKSFASKVCVCVHAGLCVCHVANDSAGFFG